MRALCRRDLPLSQRLAKSAIHVSGAEKTLVASIMSARELCVVSHLLRCPAPSVATDPCRVCYIYAQVCVERFVRENVTNVEASPTTSQWPVWLVPRMPWTRTLSTP